VPVTDEALTQCIKTLRRRLGDDASRPRFIETVPKHGYRFIAPVAAEAVAKTSDRNLRQAIQLGLGGTAGGAVAGVFGGLFYGFAAAAPGVGAISVLLVLLILTTLLGLVGAAGVSFGIAAAEQVPTPGWHWSIAGGAFGGVLVGALVKLLGLDAFTLLLGSAPADMTGAPEGAILGAAVGLGFVLARRQERLRVGASLAALIGAVAGVVIPLIGLHMMGGSLKLLEQRFPGSRLRLAGLFGESDFGSISQTVTGALEGALFTTCIVCAMLLARRRMATSDEF
jgi:hypothetical protein